jgi:hypothetical protein
MKLLGFGSFKIAPSHLPRTIDQTNLISKTTRLQNSVAPTNQLKAFLFPDFWRSQFQTIFDLVGKGCQKLES